MEKGIDAYIKEQFHLPPVDIRTYSPLTLAYIGDGIYDLIIRSIIVGKGNTKASRLHQETSKLVRAQAQSEMIDLLLPYLSEEETDIYRRGRNAKSPTMAKNATMTDYGIFALQVFAKVSLSCWRSLKERTETVSRVCWHPILPSA